MLAGEEVYPLQQFYLVPHLWGWFVQRRCTSPDLQRSWYASLYRLYWFLAIDLGLHLAIKLMVSVLKSRHLVRIFYRWLLSPFILKNLTIVDRSHKTLVMEHELFKHLEIEIFVAKRHVSCAARFVQDVLAACDSVDAVVSAATQEDLRRIGMDQALDALRGTFTHHYVVTFRRVLPDDTLISMTAAADEPWYAISLITYVEPRDPFLKMGTFLLKCMVQLFGRPSALGKILSVVAGGSGGTLSAA